MDRPTIHINNRQLRDLTCEALGALQFANKPPLLFVNSSRMVMVVRDERARHMIREVSESALRGLLTRSADYGRTTEKGFIACAPPMDAVRDILSLPPDQLKFDQLDAVVEAPVLRPDGSILGKAGYDPATRLYFAPGPTLRVPPIPKVPTPTQSQEAFDLINSVIAEFPFADGSSKANLIAAMLTPVVKPAIRAPAPMVLLSAPAPGTGKSLAADLAAIITTGQAGEMLSAPRDPDEWRKQITTALLSGTAIVIFDNIVHPLDNPDLCKVLTETLHSDRAFRMSVAAKEGAIMAGRKEPATWLRNGLRKARSEAEADTRSSRTLRAVAVRQLWLPCGNGATFYRGGSRRLERDHQIMISEIRMRVKKNLVEWRNTFSVSSSWLLSTSHAMPTLIDTGSSCSRMTGAHALMDRVL